MKHKTNHSRTIGTLVRTFTALLILSLLAIFALSSCGSASSGKADSIAPGAPDVNESYADKDYIDDAYTGDMVTGDILTTDRKIIKTVRQTIQTTEYTTFINALRAKISELGGYISEATYNDSAYYGGQRYASVTVRIPADKLDLFTGATRELGTVTYHNEKENDVTLEYVDIDSRISVLEAEEISLLSMLEKTETLSDILTVKKQLSSVQSELASLRAQKNSYDSLIAYSTIYMTINEVKEIEPPAEQDFGEELSGRFLGSLGAVGEFFRDAGLWLIGDSPIIIIFVGIAIGLFFLIRYLYRRYRNTKNNDDENKGQ